MAAVSPYGEKPGVCVLARVGAQINAVYLGPRFLSHDAIREGAPDAAHTLWYYFTYVIAGTLAPSIIP